MKRLSNLLWNLIGPIRRPIQRRTERFLAGCVARALESQNPARVVADEVNLVLDAVIAEQFRLQEQLNEIQQTLSERSFGPGHVMPPVSRA